MRTFAVTLSMSLLLFTAAVAAQEEVPKATLSAIQSDTALLKAQAANNAAKRMAQGLPPEAAPSGPAAGVLPGGPGGVASGSLDASVSNDPVVLGVFGPAGHTYARIRMPDGTTVSAAPGILPGGRWRLVDLANGVHLVRVRSK
ncbi:type IV pilus biogenesis protein PilP [Rhodanobacter sp. FW106-PBR-R2A-1-13]|uniref:type IV pilus biogenesis protein PilP n=1 Tax=Rhodanobacter sp. FW106-PBR-R2A-1-13 TaxID=3454845 RepID=UPI0034E51887